MTSVDVATVARYYGVSVQRIRVLLGQKRLSGSKDVATGAWLVEWPPVLRGGVRGPRFGRKPSRKYQS